MRLPVIIVPLAVIVSVLNIFTYQDLVKKMVRLIESVLTFA